MNTNLQHLKKVKLTHKSDIKTIMIIKYNSLTKQKLTHKVRLASKNSVLE